MQTLDNSTAGIRTKKSWWLVLAAFFVLLPLSLISSSAQSQNQISDEQFDTFDSQEAMDTAEEDLRSEQERAREAEVSRQLELRRQAINELQGSQGIYAPQLQEAYDDLAALYTEIEDYESAVAIYTDALQISRINTGLYSDQQIPIIGSLIQSNGQLRNWEAVDDMQELRLHISSRLYALNDQAYLEVAENYGGWKLRLLQQNLLEQSYSSYSRTAEDVSDFYERLLDRLLLEADTRPENLIGLIQGKSETDLLLARAIASTPHTSFQGTVSRYVNQQRCRSVQNANGQVVRECVSVQVQNPRYRQSQWDAKQFALTRRTSAVRESIDRLQQIADESSDLGGAERAELEGQIAELETETYQLVRQSRSRRLF